MKDEILILTVQPAANKKKHIYRLGFDMDTSAKYFYKPLSIIVILSKTLKIHVNIACGSPPKKAYDINKKELSDWIKEMEYHRYKKGTPTKLKFSYFTKNGKISLTFKSKA